MRYRVPRRHAGGWKRLHYSVRRGRLRQESARVATTPSNRHSSRRVPPPRRVSLFEFRVLLRVPPTPGRLLLLAVVPPTRSPWSTAGTFTTDGMCSGLPPVLIYLGSPRSCMSAANRAHENIAHMRMVVRCCRFFSFLLSFFFFSFFHMIASLMAFARLRDYSAR